MVLSGDGGPDAMCPTCQSIMTWKLVHWGWVGETTSLPIEVGNKCSSIIETPQLQWLSLACLEDHSSQHQGPVGLSRAVKGDGKRYQKVLKQAGAEMFYNIYNQRTKKSQFKAQDCPLQALTQNSHPGLRSHNRRVQGLLLGIRGWVFPQPLTANPFFFWSKTKVQIPLQSGNQFLVLFFPWECLRLSQSHPTIWTTLQKD